MKIIPILLCLLLASCSSITSTGDTNAAVAVAIPQIPSAVSDSTYVYLNIKITNATVRAQVKAELIIAANAMQQFALGNQIISADDLQSAVSLALPASKYPYSAAVTNFVVGQFELYQAGTFANSKVNATTAKSVVVAIADGILAGTAL